MEINEKLFRERFDKLNEKQQEAVNTIYGPVMVIAGPGTGKTEVLAMRIANLLKSEAQVLPQEILCLTYTDEATNSMRRRLLQIIGTDAHKVNIHTFHGFCNLVIQTYSEFFSLRTLQPVTDLERTEIIYKMLDDLPQGHALRKLSGNIYFDAARINRLFDMMKREHISPEVLAEEIDNYIISLPDRDGFRYKRNGKNYKVGDLKEDVIREETRKMNETRAAALLFTDYETRMQEAGRYDFNDMIIWVLEAFQNHKWMLQSYQERYQFILVDEFQDTNGSQNDLLIALAEFWEDPNIFVVGDDDQSIYEFQGARIANIVDFYNRYRETIKVVVLPHNYRSSQLIIDKAMATIQFNKKRLIEELKDLGLNKNIIASGERFSKEANNVKPVINVYANTLHEEADVVMQIDALHQQGVWLRDIAVIYSQHKQADNIMALMERKGIPYNVKKEVNILDLPLTTQIMNLLNYLDEERKNAFGGEPLIFEMMHSPYFGIDPTDIAAIALHFQTRKDKMPLRWRMVVSNPLLLETLELKSAAAIRRLGEKLDQWERNQAEMPLPMLLEKIVHEGGVVAYLLSQPDHVWHMQALHTFFEFVKDAHTRNPRINISGLSELIGKMNAENISVPVQRVVQNENGVFFYTAHSAKGNEFEYVFLVGCTKNFWEGKRGGSNEYKLPVTITDTEDDADKSYKTEVARRLFYVALTRAKKYLQVSYAATDNAGKPLENSVFVDEISMPDERVKSTLSAAEIVAHLQWAMQPVPDVYIKIANAQWIEKILQQLTMSATTLTKFMDCPLAFYYENLLRVPFQKNDALSFGISVHYALEHFFIEMKRRNEVFPDKAYLLSLFDHAMKLESAAFTKVQFERRTEQGHTILGEYYDHYIDTFAKNVELEVKINRYMLQGVPVTGKIDKLELDGTQCTVVDYKTGNPEKNSAALTSPPNEKQPAGGDYWRQMVFYKLLIENNPDKYRTMTMGMFEYIQKSDKGEFKRIIVPVYKQDEEFVLSQLKDAYSRIMNHEFDKGCGEEDCRWCNFARRYELVNKAEKDIIEIDDV